MNTEENQIREDYETTISHMECLPEFFDLYIEPQNDDSLIQAYEDDGCLHVVLGKIRGAFIASQELPKREWNRRARAVLSDLSIPKAFWANALLK